MHQPVCTNLHASTFFWEGEALVAFKPAEISCRSLKSVSAFTLGSKKKKKTGKKENGRKNNNTQWVPVGCWGVRMGGRGDKSLLFLALPSSPALLPFYKSLFHT